MFLKRIEINGFKSFADKTILEFPSSIVAIVGPNGSGKSNIVDAIRWVLGEREAKNLRGEKADDLIFSGTQKKPRVSMASVSMVFDNTDKKIPLDFNEVVVTRKAARNGVSEYLINDSKVRLKDIINLFSKARVGSRGITIISQGAADLFVSSSDEKRMDMIKEVLGLKEFELKKHDAKLKLQNTLSQIEKINAMMQEVLPRLRLLKKQALKFDKRKEIRNKLIDLEKNYYAYTILSIFLQKDKISKPISELKNKLQKERGELEKCKEKLKEIEKTNIKNDLVLFISRKKGKLLDKKSKLERELYRIETEEKISGEGENIISYHKYEELFRTLKKRLGKILNILNINKIKSEIRELLNMVESETSRKDNNKSLENERMNDMKNKIKISINAISNELKKLEEKELNASRSANSFRSKFKEAFIEVEQKKDGLRMIENKIKNIKFDIEKLEYKESEIKRKIEIDGGDYNEIVNYARRVGIKKLSELNKDFNMIENEIIKLRNEFIMTGEIDSTILEEYKKVEKHYNFLKKEYNDLIIAYSDLKKMILELENILRERFRASFSKVNDAFNEYFKIMFGGGWAKLKYSHAKKNTVNEIENINVEKNNNSIAGEIKKIEQEEEKMQGISIELAVPSKKSHSLESLSGGERSLVSLAALFSIVSIGRPPFLILDEADAALDEKNSNRFAQLIKRFSENTQFILVTHNRTIMEEANILYGITMDEGVSKVLSLKLKDMK